MIFWTFWVMIVVFLKAALVTTLQLCPKHCLCWYAFDETDDVLHESEEVHCWPKNASELSVVPVLNTRWLTVQCVDNARGKQLSISWSTFSNSTVLERLTIRNCMVAGLHGDIMKTLPSLQELAIVNGASATMDKETSAKFVLPADIFESAGKLTKLTLSNCSLTSESFPPGILCPLEKLEHLDLSHNRFSSDIFQSFYCQNYGKYHHAEHPSSENLNLSLTKGNIINSTVSSIMQQLVTLDLSGNLIEDTSSLKNLQKLQNLSLAQNKISVLPDIFKGFASLKHLNLSSNKLSVIKDFLFQDLIKLESLDLCENQLSHIKYDFFASLTNLLKLKLSGNNITDIDAHAFSSLKLLTFLHLDNNQLRSIQENCFGGLSSLRYLSLEGNKINNTSEAFKDLDSLEHLFLRDNQLTSVPLSVQNRSRLTVLDLAINHISEVSHSNFYGTSLAGVSIAENKLSFLGTIFTYTQDITHIILSNNNISDIDFSTFSGLHKLEYLNVSHNRISDLEYRLKHLRSLQHLVADNNVITMITRITFPENIKTIELQYNEISSIEPFSFYGLIHLTKVDLRFNKIMAYDGNLFIIRYNGVFKAQFLLEGNNPKCTCESFWVPKANERDSHDNRYPQLPDLPLLTCTNPHTMKVVKFQDAIIWERDLQDQNGIPDALCPFDDHVLCLSDCICHRTTDKNFWVLSCANKNYTQIPFLKENRFTHIKFQENKLKMIQKLDLANLSRLVELHLDDNEIMYIDKDAFRDLKSLRTLHLQRNHLESIQSTLFEGLTDLRKLFLHENYIVNLGLDAFLDLTALDTLTLHNNRLQEINSLVFGINKTLPNLGKLTLANNHLVCACNVTPSLASWMAIHEDIVYDYENITCGTAFQSRTPTGLLTYPVTTPIKDMDLYRCFRQPLYELGHSLFMKIIIPVCCCLAVILIIGLLAYNFREIIQVWLFARYGLRFRHVDEQDDRVYDAFVAYSGKDEDFVSDVLVPRLESDQLQFKLCLHYRDWPAGASIAEAIVASVDTSKRAIIVLSENFLKSQWCTYEFKAAYHQLLKTRTDYIILILLCDEPPPNLDSDLDLYIKTNTYLHQEDRWFWEKLKYALPEVPAGRRHRCNPDEPFELLKM